MSKLPRYFASGQICFVTLVTNDRRSILVENADLLRKGFRVVRKRSVFIVHAWVIMPDHVHAVIEVPNGTFSQVVARFKRQFALLFNERTRSNGKVWQHRFYDHIIRSQGEFARCIDYLHMNPIRKGLVTLPEQWRLSSYRRKRLRHN